MGVGLAIKRSRVPSPTTARLRNDSGQVVHTYLPPRRQSSLPHGVAGQSTFTFLKNQGAHEGRTRVTGNVKGGLETVVFRNLDLVRVADLPGRRRLRSSSSHQLFVPPFRLTTVGRRTFPVAASLLCNSLPADIQSSPSLHVFRRHLKTFLFVSLFLTRFCDSTAPSWTS